MPAFSPPASFPVSPICLYKSSKRWLIEKYKSIEQNFDILFFAKNAPLAIEFKRLYRSVFESPEPYIAVVSTLGTKKSGLTRDEVCLRRIRDFLCIRNRPAEQNGSLPPRNKNKRHPTSDIRDNLWSRAQQPCVHRQVTSHP